MNGVFPSSNRRPVEVTVNLKGSGSAGLRWSLSNNRQMLDGRRGKYSTLKPDALLCELFLTVDKSRYQSLTGRKILNERYGLLATVVTGRVNLRFPKRGAEGG
jgi:hypothetical protein